MDNALKAMGQKIYQARKAAKMSRAALGELVGLHETTVKRYEDGDIKSPNFSKIQAFAEALNIEARDLIDHCIPAQVNDKEYFIFRAKDQVFLDSWQGMMDYYWCLNEAGQAKALEYLKDLASHPNYVNPEGRIKGEFKFTEIK